MRLMFCTNCWDVFKLVKYGERSCLCGKAKGKLTDDKHAIVNGKGIDLMLNNISLVEACQKLAFMDKNQPAKYYKENAAAQLYARPNSGYGNSRSRVVTNHSETSETEVLSPDKVAYRASQEINVTDEGI